MIGFFCRFGCSIDSVMVVVEIVWFFIKWVIFIGLFLLIVGVGM